MSGIGALGSPAMFAALRHMVGLSQQEVADEFGVRTTTVQDWESGRRGAMPPARVMAGMFDIVAEHSLLVDQILRDEGMALPRADPRRPKGWFIAAAARAIDVDADLRVEWLE